MITTKSTNKLRTLFALAVVMVLAGAAFPATFTVTNTSDSGPGSLREAIESANFSTGLDLIAFDIPGPGPHTIKPLTPLPVITDPVTIDGYTQTGATPATHNTPATLLIELDGINVIDLHYDSGLNIWLVGNCTVRGLVINRFGDAGIHIHDGGNNIIEGNYLGTNVKGTVAKGNYAHGVRIWNAPNNRIGGLSPAARNVISGNDYHGVEILLSNATGNKVQGNYIGTDVTGKVALSNLDDGMRIKEGANNNTIGPGNVISANGRRGIEINGNNTAGNTVQGNYIGTDVTGTIDLGNFNSGVNIWNAPGNTIGGTMPGSRNVISGNEWVGVDINGSNSTGNTVQGNYIGTDVTGTIDLGNFNSGVNIWRASGNMIGGTTPEARNIISGNGDMGVIIHDLAATGNIVQGNYIGIDVTGTEALGNFDHGVHIGGAASGNIIGSSSGAGNVISGNGGSGVAIHGSGTTSNQILNNFIGTDAFGGAFLGNTYGVKISSESSSNTAIGNTISDNTTGVYILNASDNQIYNNNLINNGIQANVNGGSGNVFNMDKPIGGNYWNNWTSPDNNGDGFVDNPYIFSGGLDNLPWAIPYPQMLVKQLITQVEGLNLQQGIDNSLDAKLNAVIRALDDLNQNNDVAAINSLEAFINEVEAQRGKKISDADADALIAAALLIINLL